MNQTKNLRPIGREAALDGATTQLAVLEFACEECRKHLDKAGKGDERMLRKATYLLWAMHLVPLAAHRMLQDYCTGELVDQRPDPEIADLQGKQGERADRAQTAGDADTSPLFDGEGESEDGASIST